MMKQVLSHLQILWQKTPHLLLIVTIICLGLALRLYKLDTPLADWHSWRQADTASVTREYVKHSYPFLQPRFHDLSNIPSGLENPDGYRMVEFPIVNFTLAQILQSQPQLDLVQTSRLTSIIASLISIICLYVISLKVSQRKSIAVTTAVTFAVMPYSVYYSRVILPEPFMVMAALLSVVCGMVWIDQLAEKSISLKSFTWGALTWTFLALALLLKPTAIFFAPLIAAYAIITLGWWGSLKQWPLWLLPLAALPYLFWRNWISQYPEGIPAFMWLLNGNGIRLRPAWWRWLFSDRLGRLMLGYWGSVFVTMGLIANFMSKKKDELGWGFSKFDFFTLVWAASGLSYLIIFATGNVQHDYYQIPLVPVLSLLVARGIIWLAQTKRTQPVLVVPSLVVIIGLSLYFSWYEVKGYYNINNPAIVTAGQAVDQITPAESKVIAPYGGDTAFLFQTNRSGWPIGGLIPERIDQGATHYVSTSYDDEAKELEIQYQVLKHTPEFILIDLTTPNSSASSQVSAE